VTIEATTKILVVDDEDKTAQVIRDWYKGRPVQVLEAKDGDEGVRTAISEKPDIILMDLMMPKTNGFEASRRLKADPATAGIPVILLSARREPQTKREGFDAGIDQYVEKPFDLDEIEARIRSMIDKSKAYLKLEEEATVDEKTGLANYRVFFKKLREEWERSERYKLPLSVVMLDLDDFKKVNDTVGHPAGDKVLREFAMLVSGGARATDLAARYGGEEFAMILPHTDRERAERVAERVRAAVADFSFLEPEHPLRVTVSAGAATFAPGSIINTAEQLVAAADRALYAAKKAGKNQVVVDEP
jgi:two-component system cell cycle response regulator